MKKKHSKNSDINLDNLEISSTPVTIGQNQSSHEESTQAKRIEKIKKLIKNIKELGKSK